MRTIIKKIVIHAPVHQVYNLWKTNSGINSFLGVKSQIDFKINGSFEIYFDQNQQQGFQGSEGCIILAIEENNFLSFTWNVPPVFSFERRENYQSIVKIRFNAIEKFETELMLINEYKKETKNLEDILLYFENAWEIVLNNLKKVIEQ